MYRTFCFGLRRPTEEKIGHEIRGSNEITILTLKYPQPSLQLLLPHCQVTSESNFVPVIGAAGILHRFFDFFYRICRQSCERNE